MNQLRCPRFARLSPRFCFCFLYFAYPVEKKNDPIQRFNNVAKVVAGSARLTRSTIHLSLDFLFCCQLKSTARNAGVNKKTKRKQTKQKRKVLSGGLVEGKRSTRNHKEKLKTKRKKNETQGNQVRLPLQISKKKKINWAVRVSIEVKWRLPCFTESLLFLAYRQSSRASINLRKPSLSFTEFSLRLTGKVPTSSVKLSKRKLGNTRLSL